MAGLTVAAFASSAGPASADHHLIKIREFFPGTAATFNDSFLELQMFSGGQNLTGGSEVHVYPPGTGAAAVHQFNPSVDPANGQSQRTVLAAGSSSGLTPDYTENFDFDGSVLSPTGGAICFVSTAGFGTIDCVEWGTGNTNVDAGPPVLPGGIPDGSSIERSIGRRCTTLLEAADDTGSSAADFAELTEPTPRANAEVPTERACPDTRFTRTPAKETTRRRATFRFKATPAAESFECKLDRNAYRPCDSPYTKRVRLGRHTFKVLAEDEIAPARYSWKVVKG